MTLNPTPPTRNAWLDKDRATVRCAWCQKPLARRTGDKRIFLGPSWKIPPEDPWGFLRVKCVWVPTSYGTKQVREGRPSKNRRPVPVDTEGGRRLVHPDTEVTLFPAVAKCPLCGAWNWLDAKSLVITAT